MIDPEKLPLEEMSLYPKAQVSSFRHSWRELTVYMREVHPAFHTTGDYRAALIRAKQLIEREISYIDKVRKPMHSEPTD